MSTRQDNNNKADIIVDLLEQTLVVAEDSAKQYDFLSNRVRRLEENYQNIKDDLHIIKKDTSLSNKLLIGVIVSIIGSAVSLLFKFLF